MSILLEELQRRFETLFGALSRDDDVAPGLRLRCEGVMEATVLSGEAAPQQIDELLDRCYRAAYGEGVAETFGTDWRQFYPFPQIPATAQRAPVYPSTSD